LDAEDKLLESVVSKPGARLDCFDGFTGGDPCYRIKIRVICSRPYHALFRHTMPRAA